MTNRETDQRTNQIELVLAIVQETAGAVVMASADDRAAIIALEPLFGRAMEAAPEGPIQALAAQAVSAVAAFRSDGGGDGAALLDELGGLVTRMQREVMERLMAEDAELPRVLSARPPPAPAPDSGSEPAHAPALDLEPAPAPAPVPVADPVPDPVPEAELDWAPPAVAQVSPPAEEISSAPPAPIVAPVPVEVRGARDAPAARDAETIELLGDFLQEAGEGVDKVDALLIEIEQGGGEAERINALFRVFHTIKGVAASLEVFEVTRLAHVTETLLDQVRSGVATLSGERLERVFEAAALMRKLLAETRTAVEKDTAFATMPEVGPMIELLNAVLVGASAPAAKPKTLPAPKPAMPPPAEAPAFASAPLPMPRLSAAPAALPSGAPEAAPDSALMRKTAAATPPEPAMAVNAPAAVNASAPGAGRLRETVKVDLDRVDSIVEMIGELIIVESMVVNAPEIAALSSLRVRNYLSQLTKISRDLQNIAMRMRMVPVQGVFQKMARMVRDLARKTGKNVVLVQSGESAEMDRSMVERIEDPLVHMIRNSMDHGIEQAADRVAAGKSPGATIRLSAYHEGGSIVIEIADDGRGLSREAILKKARAQGLVRDTDNPTDAEVWGLIFLPGFSTAAKVTEISGRGVGMDVVKRNIESMRGRVTVTSTAGQGTTFRLILPLTLAIIDGMLVACGDERYIIPSLSIIESLKPSKEMVHAFADRGELINVRGEMLPLVRLQRLFGIGGEERAPTDALVVVVEAVGRKVGLLVDDVITQQQVVIKPLGEGLGDTELLAGAAILSDGRVGLILNIDRIGGDASGGHLHRTRTVAEEAA